MCSNCKFILDDIDSIIERYLCTYNPKWIIVDLYHYCGCYKKGNKI